ncbi:MAG: APC family permease [Micromonosporaceae bacterium]|jgi:amino acid transporter|nr:APC family permease [Micromonosporaceae bacterium]
MADTAVRGRLAGNAVGLREVLFQSITHMAPGAAVAFSIIVGAAFAGGALPLSVLLALVGCLFVAVSIGQLAKHLPSAAGFATYAARGLHPGVGFLVAWGYALAEAMVAPLLYLVFGHVLAGTLAEEYGWPYETWWPIGTVGAAVVVLLLGWFGIRVSAVAGTLLGLFEIAVFAALAIWMIVKAGDANTLSVFGTGPANSPDFGGWSGVIAGSVFTILAFIGFEAAAPLAEEARNPRRTVQIAVVASAVLIGAFYLLTTYAAAVYFGPDRFTGFAGFGDGNPWQQMARDLWGGAWVLIFVAIVISAIANSNAGANASTRTWYALGRARILTAMLTETHPRWRSPYVGVLVQFAIALLIALPLGFIYDPYPTAFGLVGTAVTVVIILIYIVLNLACIGFYLRRRSDFNPFWHLVVPVLGVAAFVPAILTALGIEVFAFVTALTWPFSLAGPVVAGWLGLGLLYLLYLLWTGRRDRVSALGQLFGPDEGPPGRADGAAAKVPEQRPATAAEA